MNKPADKLKALQVTYLQALVDGDSLGASEIVNQALRAGLSPRRICHDVFSPALREIGRRWELGELSVAGEHLATQITVTEVERLRLNKDAPSKLDRTVLVSCVEGEQHSVGALMLAALMSLDGWSVTNLGANTPTDALLDMIGKRKPDLVVLSITLAENLSRLGEALSRISALDDAPRVMVGGPGAVFQTMPGAVSTEIPVTDLKDACSRARELVGVENKAPGLEAHLSRLGKQIQSLRKEQGWSQQVLAERAGLDRTYISAVERGRQNVTLGACHKISRALGVPLEQLLTGF